MTFSWFVNFLFLNCLSFWYIFRVYLSRGYAVLALYMGSFSHYVPHCFTIMHLLVLPLCRLTDLRMLWEIPTLRLKPYQNTPTPTPERRFKLTPRTLEENAQTIKFPSGLNKRQMIYWKCLWINFAFIKYVYIDKSVFSLDSFCCPETMWM